MGTGTRVFISIIAGCLLAGATVIPLNAYNQYKQILTSPTAIINRKDTGIVLADRQGRSFFHFYEAKSRRLIPLTEVPLITQQAIIAIEDETFYSHWGISPQGIVRSMIKNIQAGRVIYGGSTITQQVIKNSLLTPKKSWLRKYQEAFLAFVLEKRYSKQQILEMYVNSAYFGEGAFGIEEATQTYFGKRASELTLSESALLAGLLTSPSTLSPLSHEGKDAKTRQSLVLENMRELGFITAKQKQTALKEKLAYSQAGVARNAAAPHFALLVRDELIKTYGEEALARAGIKVVTTLDLDIQTQAETALVSQLETLKVRGANNGAVVIIDPTTHEVMAMVGSKNWFSMPYGKVNMAVSPRQPGSSFKPIVYAAGFDTQNITPATTLSDVPTTFGTNYRPADYDGKYRGPVAVRRALANSLNIPAVQVMQKVGVRAAIHIAEQFGITSLGDPNEQNLALALGAGEVSLLEMTNAYATLSDQGQFLPSQTILSITDKRGQAVDIEKPTPKEAVSPETAFLISSILSDNKARAEIFGNTLTISRPAAVKTGTSQSYRDAWTIGYTPQLTVGVWIGNNDNQAMDKLAGALGAAPVWKNLMEKLLEGKPTLSFAQPSNITTATLCWHTTDENKNDIYHAAQEYFVTGTQPLRSCQKKIQPSPLLQLTKTKEIPVPIPAQTNL